MGRNFVRLTVVGRELRSTLTAVGSQGCSSRPFARYVISSAAPALTSPSFPLGRGEAHAPSNRSRLPSLHPLPRLSLLLSSLASLPHLLSATHLLLALSLSLSSRSSSPSLSLARSPASPSLSLPHSTVFSVRPSSPNAISSPNANAKVYNNATFDDASDKSVCKASWTSLQPIPIPIQAFESNCSKENRNPIFCPSSDLTISQPPMQISQGKPLKLLFKQGLLSPPPPMEPKQLDTEIEEIEKEISRLSSRLEALRIKKTSCEPKAMDRRQSIGRIFPAKLMEPKQSAANRIQESPAMLRRRGVSLGPWKVASGVRFQQQRFPPSVLASSPFPRPSSLPPETSSSLIPAAVSSPVPNSAEFEVGLGWVTISLKVG